MKSRTQSAAFHNPPSTRSWQRKQKQFIPKIASHLSEAVVPPSASERPKPTYSEVMARNASRVQDEGFSSDSGRIPQPATSSRQSTVPDEQPEADMALTIEPFFILICRRNLM
jgi:hypothetical protein